MMNVSFPNSFQTEKVAGAGISQSECVTVDKEVFLVLLHGRKLFADRFPFLGFFFHSASVCI